MLNRLVILKPHLCFFLTCSFILISSEISFSQSWNALSSGTNGTVYAVAVFNNELIAAGSFTTAGVAACNRIARWNGTAWAPLGTGMNAPVYALTVFNGQLIAGGNFTTAGGLTVNRIARWTGSAWAALGLGMNGDVYALAVYGSQLRAGGSFTTAGGISASRIARWDGTNWLSMGTPEGCNNNVYSLTVFGSNLILGGLFTQAGPVNANRVASYNTNGTFAALALGIDTGSVLSLAVFNSSLYVGGNYTHVAGVQVNYIARWSGTNWFPVGSGTNGSVNALSVFGTSLVIGGNFTNAGGISANRIAAFNGTTWSPYGPGISGGGAVVNALGTWANVLIAGGSFTNAGLSPVPASNIAGWGIVPGAPALISPPDGAQGISITPTLDWSDVTGASTYGVQVSTNPNFTTLIINASQLTVSQYFAPGGLLQYNTSYFWRANAANGLGTGPFSLIRFFTTGLVGIINNKEIPLSFNLYQNFPNPFNPVTIIRFDLPAGNDPSDKAVVSLIDAAGREVTSLYNGQYVPGKYEITFDGSGYASGIYFCKISAGKFNAVSKIILVK